MPLHPEVLDLMYEIYCKKTFENKIPVFYKDQLGRRTIGVGYLLDRDNGQKGNYKTAAQRLANLAAVRRMKGCFVKVIAGKPSEVLATEQEILQDWKDAGELKQTIGGDGRLQVKPLGTPRVMLKETAIRKLFDTINEIHLKKMSVYSWFQAFLDKWPADAQLGILAIAYAAPGLLSRGEPFGKVPQWCKVGSFDKAAQACLQSTWRGSMHRKEFFAKCFTAAHHARTNKEDENILHVRTMMAE